jgi:two-component system sensor histidine kinase AlgZ
MQSPEDGLSHGRMNPDTGEFLIPDLCSPRAVFVMVLLAELMVLVYALASSSLPALNWDLLASCSLFMQWVVLSSAALLCPLRKVFARLSLALAATCSLLLVMAVAGVSSVLAIVLYPQLPFAETGIWWVIRNVLVAMVLAGIALRYFYMQQQLQMREKSELQARLDSLRARIRPHFLFNTLNSIASLIATRPEAAEQAVEDLSELFRSNLQEHNNATTVDDELRLCRLYLDIEQLRLGDRLAIEWLVDDDLLEEPMAGLLLQPLVENAVYHGIAQLPAGGKVVVEVAAVNGKIQARIENPIPARAGHTQGNQMALQNIEQRLQGLYGTEAGMTIQSESGFFQVQLYYPFEAKA